MNEVTKQSHSGTSKTHLFSIMQKKHDDNTKRNGKDSKQNNNRRYIRTVLLTTCLEWPSMVPEHSHI